MLLLHGWPGCRLIGASLDETARRRGVRLIAPDRPGVGRSDALRGRRLADWPADACALLDHLGVARVGVVGYSAGCAYALALARFAAARLDGVAVVSPMGPLDDRGVRAAVAPPVRAVLAAARRSERLAAPVLEAVARALSRAPADLGRRLVAIGASAPARAARPELRDAYRAELVEAFHAGAAGVAREAAINGSPWGFRLEDIALDVQLFHGENDANVPVAVGRRIADRLPRCTARYAPGGDHFWLFDHFDDVLDALESSVS